MIEPEPLQQFNRTCARLGSQTFSYFSGCDYYRLASHPAVIKAVRDGLKKFGLNVAASRMTTGNHAIYKTLEKALAAFFNADDALLVPDGYMASLAVAQGLAGEFSHALVDERAHPALLDAATMLDCPIIKFKHRDPDHLAAQAVRCGSRSRPLLLTDGLFAHDGSAAPLKAYLKILPRNGRVMVDDAHGAGVLGRHGRGAAEAEGVGRRRVIQCITLSKAFGSFGGAVIASRSVRHKIQERSRLFIGSTPLPLPLANAALAAVRILKSDRSLRQRLIDNTAYVRSALRLAGWNLPETPGPIISAQLSTSRADRLLKKKLLSAGIYPPFVKYPGASAKGYFRFALSSEHSKLQLNQLIEVLIEFRSLYL